VKWLPRTGTQRHSRGLSVAVASVLAALLVTAAVLTIGLSLLLIHRYPWQVHDNNERLGDVVRLAFASLAGLGGAVALVVTYRRQRDLEINRFTEQFGAAASQLGDGQAAVRLAGVYAMAALADEWPHRQQQCIDVLCAYLRLPYLPDPREGQLATVTSEHSWSVGDGQGKEQRTYVLRTNDREVRHTVIRIIRDHLRPGVAISWQGRDFDFTGATFDGCDFSGAHFSGGTARFADAKFSGGQVDFSGATFSGSQVDFGSAKFSGGEVDFGSAKFSGGQIDFGSLEFSGDEVYVIYYGAEFSGSQVDFGRAKFSGSQVDFGSAKFSGGRVDFGVLEFSGGKVHFGSAEFSGGQVDFRGATFSGSQVGFREATLTDGRLRFSREDLTAAKVQFSDQQLASRRVLGDDQPYTGADDQTEMEQARD